MNEKILYSLVHDLRTPLSSITSIVNLLKKHNGFSHDELKWLEMIEVSSSNSNAMVNQLLESKELMINNVELQLIDLNNLIDNVVIASNLIAVTKNITIDLQKEEPTCFANVDAIKFYRLISNLMNNAIKFSFESGTIEIKVSKFTNLATISIKDFGIGISENYLQSIFDPFTKAKRKGTNNEISFGLGLSICKQIAELHGGTIKVISEPGQGSEFVVSLPLSV
ncbi:MAG: HAMP domain-containing sensor histidine kinase [Bacteroidota bacterium]